MTIDSKGNKLNLKKREYRDTLGEIIIEEEIINPESGKKYVEVRKQNGQKIAELQESIAVIKSKKLINGVEVIEAEKYDSAGNKISIQKKNYKDSKGQNV